MLLPITGGCACGAVRYSCSKRPLTMFNCHCKTCQQLSGGPYSPVVIVFATAFTLTKGTLKYHMLTSASNRPHKRGFCGDCGSRITGAEFPDAPRLMGLSASSLDDPSIFKAAYDVFVSQAAPWDRLDPSIPHYLDYPPKR